MTPERWTQLQSLIVEAEALPQDARPEFLDGACIGDPALRAEVEAMLQSSQETRGLFERPEPTRPSDALGRPLPAGTRLGPWSIQKLVGRGGMGEVYDARRADGAFELRVAIKLLKRGLDSEAVVARFTRERRILAQLDHPNVAHVLDAGVAEDGRPFLAMEYVEGQAITEYIRGQSLPTAAVLRLMITVCEAVQAAHAKRIIHRDLKPNNVLVSNQGQVKLLDFGVAKALAEEDADATRMAGEAHALTPAYAAPEQLLGRALTPASDVYALGVMLYQVLTERLPHQRGGRSATEIALSLGQETTQRPSSVLRKDSGRLPEAQRSERLHTISKDLDLIVLKALHAVPGRRYASAGELAQDLLRLLEHKPVLARPDSLGYRATRFVQRNRLAVASVSAVILALSAGLAAALWQAHITRAREAELEQVVSFQSGMLQRISVESMGQRWLDHMRERLLSRLQSDPGLNKERLLANFDELRPLTSPTEVARQTLGESILEPSVNEINQRFAKQPALRARLMYSVAQDYYDTSLNDRDIQLLDQLLAFARPILGENDDVVLNARQLQARASAVSSNTAAREAVVNLEDVIRRRTALEGADGPNTLEVRLKTQWVKLTNVYGYIQTDEARSETELLVQDATRALGPESPISLEALEELAKIYSFQGKFDDANAILRRVVESRRRLGNLDTKSGLLALGLLCENLSDSFNLVEALAVCEDAVVREKRVLGDRHIFTLNDESSYADALRNTGRSVQSAELKHLVAEEFLQTFGRDNIDTVQVAADYIVAMSYSGKAADVLPVAGQQLVRSRGMNPIVPDFLANALWAQGIALTHLERYSEAGKDLVEAHELASRTYGPGSLPEMEVADALGWLLIQASNWDGAVRTLRPVAEHRKINSGPENPATRITEGRLGDALSRQGRFTEAVALMEPALASMRKKLPPDSPDLLDLQARLGRTHRDMGQVAQGCAELASALAGLKAEQPDILYIQHAERELAHCPHS